MLLRARGTMAVMARVDPADLRPRRRWYWVAAGIAVGRVPEKFTFLSGGRTWAALFEVSSDRSGRAGLACEPAGGGRPLLAVGDAPDQPRLLRALGGSVAAGAAVALPALLAGGVMAVVVARRRSAHRRRLGG
jgi:hypothetical protein